MLRKKFMILETNLPEVRTGPKGDHLICTTQIGTKTRIFSHLCKTVFMIFLLEILRRILKKRNKLMNSYKVNLFRDKL